MPESKRILHIEIFSDEKDVDFLVSFDQQVSPDEKLYYLVMAHSCVGELLDGEKKMDDFTRAAWKTN